MTVLMGVLNVTPDSFSDGGKFVTAESAVTQARLLVAQGASIIDIGGESTRPGARPVPLEEELERVLPVVEALVAEGLSVSVDTIHAATAEAAARLGAQYINDVSGGLADPDMVRVAAEAAANGTTFIIGHWRGIPDLHHVRSNYSDVVTDVRDALAERVQAAVAAGVPEAQIIVDPGLGFDKTGEQCWELLRRIDEIRALGHRVLIGASRKRMLTEVLATIPGAPTGPLDRDLATSIVSALAARSGVWGVRVHDVAGSAQALAVEHAWGNAVGDRITLTGLEVFAHHGVFDFEREAGQTFIIDADVAVDLRSAAAGDDLANTVHYGELAEAIIAAVERDPVDLIETVAERVADVALGFAAISEARITVHKPDAPIDAEFADVSVTVVRRRDRR